MLNSEEIYKRWESQSQMLIEGLSEFIGETVRVTLYPAFLQYGNKTPVNNNTMVVRGKIMKIEQGGEDYRPITAISFEGGAVMELANYQTIWSLKGSGCLTAKNLSGDQCLDWIADLDFIVEIDKD